jgi:hypothetical protein
VHSGAGQRVEIAGQRRDQGLAFARLHLGDGAAVQDHPADQLDVVVSLAQRPLGRFANRRVRLRQQVVDGLAVLDPLAVVGGLAAQVRIGEGGEVPLELVDALDQRRDPLDQPVVGAAEYLVEQSCHEACG